jgi:hypothetical protein
MEIEATRREPAISIGKCSPVYNLASPLRNANKKNTAPLRLKSRNVRNIREIENITVAWSDGKEDSAACAIMSVPVGIMKGLG